jgi:hypothetical protein
MIYNMRSNVFRGEFKACGPSLGSIDYFSPVWYAGNSPLMRFMSIFFTPCYDLLSILHKRNDNADVSGAYHIRSALRSGWLNIQFPFQASVTVLAFVQYAEISQIVTPKSKV